jgi:hypothetical protein
MQITDTGIAEAQPQVVGNGLLLCSRRRHSVNEALDVAGEVMVTGFGKQTDHGDPAAFDLAPCFYKRALAAFDANVARKQFSRGGFDLRSNVGRIVAQTRAIYSILLRLPSLAEDRALGRVGLDAEEPRIPGKLRSPVPGCRLRGERLTHQTYRLEPIQFRRFILKGIGARDFDSVFCANAECMLHIRAGEPSVKGNGNWAETPDGIVTGRQRVQSVTLCDRCAARAGGGELTVQRDPAA